MLTPSAAMDAFVLFADRLCNALVAMADYDDKSVTGGMGDNTVAIGSDWGASLEMRKLMRDLIGDGTTSYVGIGDQDFIGYLLYPISNAQKNTTYQAKVVEMFSAILQAMDSAARGFTPQPTGVTDFLTLASYVNIGGGVVGTNSYTRLLPPTFRALYKHCKNVAFSAHNVYSPQIDVMGTFASSGPTFTDGSAVDTTRYAGVAVPVIRVTSTVNASNLVLEVIGNGRSATGLSVTGKRWRSATINGGSVANDTEFALTPIAGDEGTILTDVTNISVYSGTYTSGTVVCRGKIPAGRTAIYLVPEP